MDRVPIFRFWCQHILPLVYDNSLSYYETLCKVVAKLNEVVDTLNSYSDELEQMINQKFLELQAQLMKEMQDYQHKVNAQLDSMQNQMDTIEGNLNKQIADFTAEITQQLADQNAKFEEDSTALRQYVDNTVNELTSKLESQMAAQDTKVTAQITALTNYVNGTVAALQVTVSNNLEIAKAYTDSEIQKLKDELVPLTTVYVRDPTTGLVADLQTVLNNMYEQLRTGALTAYEYDSLMITAAKYESYNLTAWQYDNEGKKWLYEENEKKNYTFSEATGDYVDQKQTIAELYELNRTNGYSASYYDNSKNTAEQWDSYNLTAYYYDWNNTIRPPWQNRYYSIGSSSNGLSKIDLNNNKFKFSIHSPGSLSTIEIGSETYNASTIDLDEVIKNLTAKGSEIVEKLKEYFPTQWDGGRFSFLYNCKFNGIFSPTTSPMYIAMYMLNDKLYMSILCLGGSINSNTAFVGELEL